MAEKVAVKMHKEINPLVLITVLIVIATLLTYVIPAGEFDRAENSETGKVTVVAGTYHVVESKPASFSDFALSFDSGIKDAVSIISFLMLIGGAFGIVNSTGAIEALMARFIVKFKSESSKNILIAGLLLFFALGGGTFGMSLEGMVFAPFLIILMINMGYDAIVGISIPVIGSSIGYGSAYLNPFTLGIAQGIAGLPYTSGMPVRLLLFVIFYFTSVFFIIHYAKEVKNNPQASLCTPGAFTYDEVKNPEDVVFNKGQKRVLIIFVVAIAFLIYGTVFKGFFMAQCATVFLFMGFLAGLAYKMKPSEIAGQFLEGVKTMVMPCVVMGFSRSIMIILEDASVIDTIIYYLSLPLNNFSPIISAPLMVIVQTLVNFFINSGSAQATIMMPLMTPIADLINVNRQVAVLAFQVGDGISNIFWVTASILIVGLGIAKVSYGQWLKYIYKLFLLLLCIGTLVVSIAQMLNWGPF